MLIGRQVLQQVEQLLRIGLLQFGNTQIMARGVIGTILGIACQEVEVRTLIQFVVHTALGLQCHKLCIGLIVHLGTFHQMLQKRQCLRHILTQSVQTHGDAAVAFLDVVVTCQSIELLLDLLSRQRVGTQIIQISTGITIAHISLSAEGIVERHLETTILAVVHIDIGQVLLCFSEGQVLLKVHKTWCDRLHLRSLDVLHKLAHQVTVGGNRCDSRLFDFLLIGVHALLLKHRHVVVLEMVLGKGHNLVLRHALQSCQRLHLLFPCGTVDKRLYEHIGTRLIALQGVVIAQLHVVDHRRQQVVREVTLLQLLNLGQQQLAHLFQRLSLLGRTSQYKGGVVHTRLHTCASTQHRHLMVDVQVNEACGTIAQHALNHLQGVNLQRRSLVESIANPQVLSLQADDGGVHMLRQLLLGRILRLLHVLTRLPLSEVLVDGGNHLIGVKVASHTDSHVVGHIPLLEVVLDIGNRGVLQVLLRTNSGLCAIGVRGIEFVAQSIIEFIRIVSQIDVILLVHSLQLRMETTDGHVHEAVCLDLGPVVNLVRGDILHIASHVIARIGIRALRADGGHQLIVFIGNVVLGCQLTQRVNLVVGLTTLHRVGHLAILLIALLNLVEQWRLFLGIDSTKLAGALKHQVLQIVSQTCCLSRVVLRTCAHGDIGLNARFLFVHAEIHLQSVVKGIDARLRHITHHSFILVLRARAQSEAHEGHSKK